MRYNLDVLYIVSHSYSSFALNNLHNFTTI